MSTVLWMIVSFILGAMFGNLIQIREDYSDAYSLGWNDAIDYCTEHLDELVEEETDDD